MRSSFAHVLVLAALLMGWPSRASARFVPVLRQDVRRLVKRRARLFVVRPCYSGSNKRWFVPGDSIRAAHMRHRNDTAHVGYGEPVRRYLSIECLSKTPLDYSFRRKQSLARLARDLLRDGPRVVRRHNAIYRKSRFRELKEGQADHERRLRYRRHLAWIQDRLSRIHRGRKSYLRSRLKAEGGWLKKHGERFIMQYVGERDKALQRLIGELRAAAEIMNKYLAVYPYRIHWQRKKLERLKLRHRYKGAPSKIRGTLMAGDIERIAARLSKLEREHRDYRKQLRQTLARAKVRARWK